MNLEGMDVIFENENVMFVASDDFEVAKDLVAHYFYKDLSSYYKTHDVYFVIKKNIDEYDFNVRNVITIITNENNYDVFDSHGTEEQIHNIMFLYPELVDVISDILGPIDLITTLTLIEGGRQFTEYTLKRKDKMIASIEYKKFGGSSKIYIEFDSDSSFFEKLGFSEDDMSYISPILGDYGGDIFPIDGYEEFREGYILNSLSEKNNELINQIVMSVYPQGYDWQNDDITRSELAEYLYNNFESQVNPIIWDYERHKHQAGAKALREELNTFCNVFAENGITIVKKHCFYQYWVYVSYLKDILLKYKASNISDLIKEIAENEINASLRYEPYEYAFHGNFNNEEFDNDVESELEKIITRIDSKPEQYGASLENKKLIEILKKYHINETHKLNGDRGSFKITKVFKGRLYVTHYTKEQPNGVQKSFSGEEFNNFISTPELFERLIWKLKKLL